MEDIKDIKPIFELSDYYFHIASLVMLLIILIIAAIYLYKFFKKKKACSRAEYINKLNNIKFDDSKNAAYEITKYLRLVAADQEEIKIAEELIGKLENYKYAKNVPSFDEDIKSQYEKILGDLNG